MEEKKGLIPWREFQESAWSGSIPESTAPFPTGFAILTRWSGIECPNERKRWNTLKTICRAHLLDTNVVIESGNKPMRLVYCDTCSAWFLRLMGNE